VGSENFLIGLVLGIAAGMAIQYTLRAWKDLNVARRFAQDKQRIAWRAMPRFTILGFLAICAAVAAIRLYTGAGG
jgi:hypothetical protein